MTGLLFAAVVALLYYVQSTAAADTCANTLTTKFSAPVVAGGWSYRLVANGFKRPRGILFDQEGGLLVVDSQVGITRLALTDGGGTCLSVSKQTAVVSSSDVRLTSLYQSAALTSQS